MGSSPVEIPGAAVPPIEQWPPASADLPLVAAPREPLQRYVALFLLTLVTTTAAGVYHYIGFYGLSDGALSRLELVRGGLWYSLPVLAILASHELGHYYACRYYGINVSRPYFLPFPLPPTGTLGAFIRIRQPIASKRELFDIGIAGPIAGFVVLVPVLFFGMSLSHVIAIPADIHGQIPWMGEPLLLKFAARLTFGSIPSGSALTIHPLCVAAWVGMLATSLNLFPIGQLDGGHISYAILGRRSTLVTLLTIPCLVVLTFWSISWIVWTGLTVLMLIVFGPHHPRTPDEHIPLDRGRKALAAFAVIMFILCFMPAPLGSIDVEALR
jgi:membrane-associated protease RseP (regulator of RpoE activity)